MNHQRCLPQVNAGIFSMKLFDLIPRVLGRAQWVHGLWKSEFPVKPPFAFFLSVFWQTHSDGDDWVLHRNRDFILFQQRFSIAFFLQSHFTQTVIKLNPMFGYGVPQRALELAAQAMRERAPLLLLPPPSLSPQSVDHPETGSSLFVFLKKKRAMLLQFFPQG